MTDWVSFVVGFLVGGVFTAALCGVCALAAIADMKSEAKALDAWRVTGDGAYPPMPRPISPHPEPPRRPTPTC